MLFSVFFCSYTVLVSAQTIPPLRGRVNDNAGILSPQAAGQIEQAIRGFEQNNAGQIAVLTTPSLEGYSIEEFSIKVAEAWQIGSKGNDDGVIVVVAPNEREVRIEVGYGFEHVLTDLISSQIIRNVILPEFKRNDYSPGIQNGVFEIIGVVSGEYPGGYTPQRTPVQKGGESFVGLIFFIIMMLFLLSGRGKRGAFFRGMLFSMLLSGMGSRGGGGFGGGGGFSGFGGGFGGGGASGRW